MSAVIEQISGKMVTGFGMFSNGYSARDSVEFKHTFGDHEMVTAVPTCRGTHIPTRPREPTDTPRMTGRQKIALMLEKGGYAHAEIARRMGLKNRESATRLIARARVAQKAMQAALAELAGEAA